MPETSLPVEHLFTFTGTVGRGTTIKAGPMGTRVVVPVDEDDRSLRDLQRPWRRDDH
jgi:hypothetical protein